MTSRTPTVALTCVLLAACGLESGDVSQRRVDGVAPASAVEITEYPRQDGEEVWVRLAEGRKVDELFDLEAFGPLRPGDGPAEAAEKMGVSAGFREEPGRQEHYFDSAAGELAIGRVRSSEDGWAGWGLYLYPAATDPSLYIPEPLLSCCVDTSKTYSDVLFRNPEASAAVEVTLSRGKVRRIRWVSDEATMFPDGDSDARGAVGGNVRLAARCPSRPVPSESH